MTDNGDGTHSFQDVTEYSQVGDKAQASVFNGIGEEVNKKIESATLGGVPVPKNGNTLQLPAPTAWVATDVSDPDSNGSVTLTIPGFVYSEGCQITFKAKALPQSNTYHCININSTVYVGNSPWFAIRTPAGELLSGDEWAIGANVTVTLSSASFNHPNNWPTAFFKGGAGSIKEMFDFPLSMQTAAPTPINTNHIWIQNDAKMPFVIDEAIRATDWGNDNRYYGIVDNTDNNYFHVESPKSLTDGTKTSFVNRHMAKDNTPWGLGASVFAKKYGLYYYADSWCKWPRIYSRINGVVDMENAQRWDGSAWQWLSQKGHYVAHAEDIIPVGLWNRTDSSLVKHADISAERVVGSYRGCAFSPDGNWLFVGMPNGAFVFKRDGDSFTLYTTISDSNSNNVYCIKFSPDSNYVAICINSGVAIYKKQSNDIWTKLTQINTGASSYACAWDDTGSRLAVDFTDSVTDSKIGLYTRSGDTFTLQHTFIISNAGVLYGLDFKGNIIAVASGKPNYLRLLSLSSNTSATIINSNDSLNPPGQGSNPVMLSGNRIFLSAAVGQVGEYTYTDSSLTLVGYITPHHTNAGSLGITPDEKYAFLLVKNYLDIFSISGTTMTLIQSIPINNGNLSAVQISVL